MSRSLVSLCHRLTTGGRWSPGVHARGYKVRGWGLRREKQRCRLLCWYISWRGPRIIIHLLALINSSIQWWLFVWASSVITPWIREATCTQWKLIMILLNQMCNLVYWNCYVCACVRVCVCVCVCVCVRVWGVRHKQSTLTRFRNFWNLGIISRVLAWTVDSRIY